MGVNRDRTYKVMDKDAFYDKYARLSLGQEERWEFMTDLKEVIRVAGASGPKRTPDVERPAAKKPSTKGKDKRGKKPSGSSNVVRGMGTTKGL